MVRQGRQLFDMSRPEGADSSHHIGFVSPKNLLITPLNSKVSPSSMSRGRSLIVCEHLTQNSQEVGLNYKYSTYLTQITPLTCKVVKNRISVDHFSRNHVSGGIPCTQLSNNHKFKGNYHCDFVHGMQYIHSSSYYMYWLSNR